MFVDFIIMWKRGGEFRSDRSLKIELFVSRISSDRSLNIG